MKLSAQPAPSSRRILNLFDVLFNRAFGHQLNPLYRSGSLTILLMTIVILTGFILIFFYRLGNPYESVVSIQENTWLLRHLRSLHRYASDAAVLAVVLHIIRMFAQGKSERTKAFAWISGVVLFIFLFVSGWTGYVMVWDAQAQSIALAGARIVDSLGILSDPIIRSFNGSINVPPPSFFFLNLFLHVVIPLMMVFGIWVHTSHMANATWFPKKRVIQNYIFILILGSILVPAPIGEKADLLKMTDHSYPISLAYGFWLSLSETSPKLTFFMWSTFFLFLIALPFFCRRNYLRLTSAYNEQEKCQGCGQCVTDCPYEAIKMVPRTAGPQVSEEVAQVISDKCVSCGLCSGSCGPMTMGPELRKGTHQFTNAKAFLSDLKSKQIESTQVSLIISCQNQIFTTKNLEHYAKKCGAFAVYSTECLGTLHVRVIEHLSHQFKEIILAACPSENCQNKDGNKLLKERLSGTREPYPARRISKEKVKLFPIGPGEENLLLQEFFKDFKGSHFLFGKLVASTVSMALGLVLLFAIIKTSGFSLHQNKPEFGMLRLSWRMQGQIKKDCRSRTEQELAKLPTHMRTPLECTQQMLNYRLIINKNGQSWINEIIRPGGFRNDRPLYVDKEYELGEGVLSLQIKFTPENEDEHFLNLVFNNQVNIKKGRIALVTLSPDQKQLILKERTE